MALTDDRDDPRLDKIDERGMQEAYLVLSEEERAKGFVRPVRKSYRHVGIPGPRFELRDLTDEERERYAELEYVKFEAYPSSGDEGTNEFGSATGRFWTQAQLESVGKGCGTVTTMNLALAETYARDPHFYGGTYCAGCRTHLRVGEHGEFVWTDELGGATDVRVGT